MTIARGFFWPYKSGPGMNKLGFSHLSFACALKRDLQLGALAGALTPALQAIKQSEFYPEPKFHVSIGWALSEGNGVSQSTEGFPTITGLPKGVIEDLNRDFASRLRRPSARLEAEEVCVKIGKDVFRWELGRET